MSDYIVAHSLPDALYVENGKILLKNHIKTSFKKYNPLENEEKPPEIE